MSRHPLLSIAVIAFVAALIAGVGSSLVVKRQIDNANRQQAAKVFNAQVGACFRQNLRSQANNRNALATYRVNTLFASALTHPSRPQTAREKKLTRDFRSRLLDLVSSLTWTPVNLDCKTQPTKVQLPVAFSKQQPGGQDLP